MGKWMLRGSLVMAVALLVGAPACGGDDPVTEDDDGGSPSSSSSTTSGAGGSGGDASTSSTTGQGGMGQGGMGQGGMGQGGQSMICEPDPNDTVCITCAKDNCCPQLQACELEAACDCVADCVLMGGDPIQCGLGCGVTAPTPTITDAVGCLNNSCANQCGM